MYITTAMCYYHYIMTGLQVVEGKEETHGLHSPVHHLCRQSLCVILTASCLPRVNSWSVVVLAILLLFYPHSYMCAVVIIMYVRSPSCVFIALVLRTRATFSVW